MFQSILKLLQQFKDCEFVSSMPDFEESWLKVFYDGVDRSAKELHKKKKSFLTKENFISELHTILKVNCFIFIFAMTISV